MPDIVKRPILLDLFCCAGGASRGYDNGGCEVYGIDNDPKRLRDYPYPWLVTDAIEALVKLIDGEGLDFLDAGWPAPPINDRRGRRLYLKDIAFIHASPPCQGYSIMNNLPWIRSRTYPLLILPVRELLEQTGKPYIIENVAGARYGAKGLRDRGLEEHGLKAGWLCGGMFGLPIYRHRYFETNFFWPMPGHPKHVKTKQAESSFSPRPRGSWEAGYEEMKPGASPQAAPVAAVYGAAPTPGQRGMRGAHGGNRTRTDNLIRGSALSEQAMGDTRKRPHLTERAIGTNGKDYAGHSPMPKGKASLPNGNGAQAVGAGVGHAAGWRVAAEAMGIDWMRRSELTQAIPPCMTAWIIQFAPGMAAMKRV